MLPNALTELLTQINHLQSCANLLSWDEEVMMPLDGSQYRIAQTATLQGFIHNLATSNAFQDALGKALEMETANQDLKLQLAILKDDLEVQKRYPNKFVKHLAEKTATTYHKWLHARETNSFAQFGKHLEQLVALKKEEADYINKAEKPLDNLLWLHDKSLNTTDIDKLFDSILPSLKELLSIFSNKSAGSDKLLMQFYAESDQLKLSKSALNHIGFPTSKSRLDISVHPFSISLHPTDTRITTRFFENDLSEGLFSTLHEMGHALYEQGLDENWIGWPRGAYSSLSIHESQSRFWENQIGRSTNFWVAFWPKTKDILKEQMKNVNLNDWLKAINVIKPGTVRTAADEVSYHLHIAIRYELEKAIFSNDLTITELPLAWNELYQKYLQITPTSLKDGILQDIHWAHGSFGYFPTYTIGSLLAAEIEKNMRTTLQNFDKLVIDGDFGPIIHWLKTNIHQYGRTITTKDLIERLKFNIEKPYLITSLQDKYQNLFGK